MLDRRVSSPATSTFLSEAPTAPLDALVSVGVPVRNGASTLAQALNSVLTQSYKNIEVIVSDNCSVDDTAEIACTIAQADPRIRYFRQPEGIPALDNFRFVLDRARGEYFVWAADDDLRTANYIEMLVDGLRGRPGATLAMSDVITFYPDMDPTLGEKCPGRRRTGIRTRKQLIRDVLASTCAEFYGAFRTQCLKEYPWIVSDWGDDVLLLFYAGLRGELIYVEGPIFYRRYRRVAPDISSQIEQGFYSKGIRFRSVRLCWGIATVEEAVCRTSMARRIYTFAYAYRFQRLQYMKRSLYGSVPDWTIGVWKQLKELVSR